MAEQGYLHLFSLVKRIFVEPLVELVSEVVDHAVITERSPLHVDAHFALVCVDQFDVGKFFHVASIRARA